ncbi:MAG: cytidylate kinase family protein, partial [Clostridia bacterium]|nr:cytidylate kinase family protein [Clostridia bacterium]
MKKIITISRQFGSGGRSIGKAVAEKLGYAYYDSELVAQVADKTGLHP